MSLFLNKQVSIFQHPLTLAYSLYISTCKLSRQFQLSINLFPSPVPSTAYPSCHNHLSRWQNVNRFNDHHQSGRDQCSTNDYEQTDSLFPAGRHFISEHTLTSNEKSPVESGKINKNTQVLGFKEENGAKQTKKNYLTGGAENLKSEEPLKARNFGEYIRSWTESCSFSSTQPM